MKKKNIYFKKVTVVGFVKNLKIKKKLENDENKVIDNCHITGKFRDAAHWNCYKIFI